MTEILVTTKDIMIQFTIESLKTHLEEIEILNLEMIFNKIVEGCKMGQLMIDKDLTITEIKEYTIVIMSHQIEIMAHLLEAGNLNNY